MEAIKRETNMNWIEIISLRSVGSVSGGLLEELLRSINESDLPSDSLSRLHQIRIYRHSVVEFDLSIHLYWESEAEVQDKSPLALRICSALKGMGLLDHSVWVQRSARQFNHRPEPTTHGDPASKLTRRFDTSTHTLQKGAIMEQTKNTAQATAEKLEAELKQWGFDLEKFGTRARQAKGDAKVKLEKEVTALRTRLNDTQKKLEASKKKGTAASGELKRGVESAAAELREAIAKAKARF